MTIESYGRMINSQSLFFDKSMRTALITGGGGFLGIEHAYALSKENYNIICGIYAT